MAGHRPFSELTKDWSAERKAAVREAADREYTLVEVRKAIGMAQATLAQTLGVTQSHISRLERQPDIQISTLRRFIEAMHGELKIVVRFGEREVALTLAELEKPTAAEVEAEEERAAAELVTAR